MEDILTLIKARKSTRDLFDPKRLLTEEDLDRILEAARWAPTAHNMQNFSIVVVDERELLDAIADIPTVPSDTFVRENYEQLSFSEEELRARKTGILATRFPPAMRRPRLDPGDRAVSSVGAPVRNTPVLLVVLYDPRRRAPASEGDFLGVISLGCVMENMWLMAESLGIGLTVMSSLAAGPVAGEVKRLLGVPEHLVIAFACRLGYPAAPPAPYPRVRREPADFVHRNRFGRPHTD